MKEIIKIIENLSKRPDFDPDNIHKFKMDLIVEYYNNSPGSVDEIVDGSMTVRTKRVMERFRESKPEFALIIKRLNEQSILGLSEIIELCSFIRGKLYFISINLRRVFSSEIRGLRVDCDQEKKLTEVCVEFGLTVGLKEWIEQYFLETPEAQQDSIVNLFMTLYASDDFSAQKRSTLTENHKDIISLRSYFNLSRSQENLTTSSSSTSSSSSSSTGTEAGSGVSTRLASLKKKIISAKEKEVEKSEEKSSTSTKPRPRSGVFTFLTQAFHQKEDKDRVGPGNTLKN